METILQKSNHTAIYVGIGAGALLAGTLAYLFFTESGSSVRSSIKEKLKDKARDIASDVVSRKTGIHKRTVRKAAEHVG